MAIKPLLIFLSILLTMHGNSFGQKIFQTVKGNKANYTLTIPPGYSVKEKIGANIDLKYVNSEGASIITTVKKIPSGVNFKIDDMDDANDEQIINQFEANGMENVTLIKRGLNTINNVKSYFMYYTDGTLYYHTINQFKNGKIINLTFTCEYANKSTYMPYIFRVVNSLKYIKP